MHVKKYSSKLIHWYSKNLNTGKVGVGRNGHSNTEKKKTSFHITPNALTFFTV